MLIKLAGKGKVIELTNTESAPLDTAYASITAREIVFVEVFIDDELHDAVYVGAGGSHSWWTDAGGKLLRQSGLQQGERLLIRADGECAMRIDWVGERDIAPMITAAGVADET